MTTKDSLIDFCTRAPFSTLLAWHRASRHVHMLEALKRTYGAREARVWLTGRVVLDFDREFTAGHFQPDPHTVIPQDTD